MTSRINKRQSQDVILYQVDQEPVWLDMAFPKSFAVFLLTRGHGIFPPTLYLDVSVDHFFQKRKVLPTLLHQLIAFLISRGKFDCQHLLFEGFPEVVHVCISRNFRITGYALGFAHGIHYLLGVLRNLYDKRETAS